MSEAEAARAEARRQLARIHSPDAWIAAMRIFARYAPDYLPIAAEHDELFVCVPHDSVSADDITALALLGWDPHEAGNFARHTSA